MVLDTGLSPSTDTIGYNTGEAYTCLALAMHGKAKGNSKRLCLGHRVDE